MCVCVCVRDGVNELYNMSHYNIAVRVSHSPLPTPHSSLSRYVVPGLCVLVLGAVCGRAALARSGAHWIGSDDGE